MDNLIDNQGSLREFLEEAELTQYFEFFRDILKVNKLSQLKFVAGEDLAQIGLSKPEQRRYKKIYSKYFPNAYRTLLKRFLQLRKTELPRQEYGTMSVDFQAHQAVSVKVPTKHIISIEDITINKELGMGQFGVVQQGTWITGNQRLQVAIKCLGNERMTSNSTEFLKEAAVMHSIEHPNIVRLYGVVLHLESLMLVTELAPLRSLLECLRDVTLRSNFSVAQLCEFAEQICDGMTYLENKRLIHRDLAVRNILVFSKDRVKISDFGLSRALGVGKDYYQTNYNVDLKLPVAWCAPECILYLKFTSSSDVWAFGVCLWEMYTYGFQPWAALSGSQILEAIDSPNLQRLERPECCPEAYYSLMLECWAHDPNLRPKFKDLEARLIQLRPEEVQTTTTFKRPENRRKDFLEYKVGQRITVLGKEDYTKSAMWFGVLPGGTCGLFDPHHTKPYVKHERGSSAPSMSPHPTRNTSRSSIRSSLSRSDVKRHTYTGKRSIQRSMISGPQGDVKHTGHVGLDGAYFGDLSFLDPAGCPPKQMVTQYKPSEDMEQVPLINPNSPSHLTATTSTSPYPLLTSTKPSDDMIEVEEPNNDKPKSLKKADKSNVEPTSSKRRLIKMKNAPLGRSHRNDDITDEIHEYHEIFDDAESIAPEPKGDVPNCPALLNGCNDFSQSLLDEMEILFRSVDISRGNEANSVAHVIGNLRTEKRRHPDTGTMKFMTAREERTLNTAVALANELTSKSMNDLEWTEPKPLQSPCERSKFNFKFPHKAEADKEAANKAERRNFSEEAKSVPDIQATISEDGKKAYASLIEQPTPSSSLISQMEKQKINMDITVVRLYTEKETVDPPVPDVENSDQRSPPRSTAAAGEVAGVYTAKIDNLNEMPLPPRGSKPKLVDKPRHVRKYPLRLPTDTNVSQNAKPIKNDNNTIIYQNTVNYIIPTIKINDIIAFESTSTGGIDVFDGPEAKVGTNPFTIRSDGDAPGSSSRNPFKRYLDVGNADNKDDGKQGAVGGVRDFGDDMKMNKDHVSVEDLLAFADKKPSSQQRGFESDEVRIMNKVLNQQVE